MVHLAFPCHLFCPPPWAIVHVTLEGPQFSRAWFFCGGDWTCFHFPASLVPNGRRWLPGCAGVVSPCPTACWQEVACLPALLRRSQILSEKEGSRRDSWNQGSSVHTLASPRLTCSWLSSPSLKHGMLPGNLDKFLCRPAVLQPCN